jgi:NAD(P)-dependent dehydrogenase (short-subunit alcohol dehydrogenase family)
MLLQDKNAVIYGGGGAIGGAVARAFAREGARVFLTGRTMDKVDAVAGDISAAGGTVETAQVDALDERAVEEHADAVAREAGRIDVSFNAIGIPQHGVQGIPLVKLSPESFGLPIRTYTTAQFLTARAAARRMVEHGSGVILTLTATPARLAAPLVGGMGAAFAAVEALTRGLLAELGPRGVRAVCLRPNGIPETATIQEVYGLHAEGTGMTRDEFHAFSEGMTLLGWLPTLAEVANVATFIASDQASAMTETVANLSGGAIVD